MELRLDGRDFNSKVADDLAKMRERARHLEPVLKGRAQRLVALIDSSFAAERDPWGDDWRPLSEATREQRRQDQPRILVDTGALRQATHARARKNRILFGVSGAPATYGRAHQFVGQVPPRPFLPVDPSKTPSQAKPLFGRGPAKKWRDTAVKKIARYIRTGKLK